MAWNVNNDAVLNTSGGGGADATTLEGNSAAQLKDRANHTGEQPINSVTGLEQALLDASNWTVSGNAIYRQGFVGINTGGAEQNTSLDVWMPSGVKQGFRVYDVDSGGSFSFSNATGALNNFAPFLAAESVGASRPLALYNTILDTDDTGTQPVIQILARLKNLAGTLGSVVVRPLIALGNNTTRLFFLMPDGNVGVGLSSAALITEKLTVAGNMFLRGTTGGVIFKPSVNGATTQYTWPASNAAGALFTNTTGDVQNKLSGTGVADISVGLTAISTPVLTIPANRLVVGSTYRWRAFLTLNKASTTPANLVLQARLSGTTLTSSVFVMAAETYSNRGVEFTGTFTVRANGTTGSVVANSDMLVSLVSPQVSVSTTTTVDTTLARTLTLTFNSTDVGTTATVTNWMIEEVV